MPSPSIADKRCTFRALHQSGRFSARETANEGAFDSFSGVLSNAELDKFFGGDRTKRSSP